MSVTYYVVLPYGRNEEGDLVAGEGQQAPSAAAARSKAVSLSTQYAGVVAFSREANLSTGEYEPAVLIARFGQTPDVPD